MNENNYKTLLVEQQAQLMAKDVGLSREALEVVATNLKNPLAVVISGLRRVGKSTLLAQIARHFYHHEVYFVNFEDERFLRFQAQDFAALHELLIELFGLKKVFLFDEIQNVVGWERFVRRLIDEGYKVYLTGSNASLLSGEIATKLTGRYVLLELFPFSWPEFLAFKKISVNQQTTAGRGQVQKHLTAYLRQGGLPDALKYALPDFYQTLYQDVLYRDIAARYHLTAIKALKELAFFLASNIANTISFNKIKNYLKLGSGNTVKNYLEYLEASWLFFTLNRYAFSVKTQQIAAKKVYAIDSGLIRSVGFAFSANTGRFLENLVFLHLRRRFGKLYYYQTKKNREVDFYVPSKKLLVQVCQDLTDPITRQREIAALHEAMTETKLASSFLITRYDQEVIKITGRQIKVVPITEWLLNA